MIAATASDDDKTWIIFLSYGRTGRSEPVITKLLFFLHGLGTRTLLVQSSLFFDQSRVFSSLPLSLK